MKKIYFIINVLLINTVWGQFSSRFQDPKTPEVYQLQKYGRQDINLYTGRPNINIPLFNIEYGQINIPFKISYSSNGIRGDEEASRIGLGWYFDLPIINQTVQGYDDLEIQVIQPDYYNYYKPYFVVSPQPDFFLENCYAASNDYVTLLGQIPARLTYSNSFKANSKDHLDGFFIAKIRSETNSSPLGGGITYFPVNGSYYNFDLQNSKVTYGKNYDVEMDIFNINLFGEDIKFYKLPNQNSFFSLNKKNYTIEMEETGTFPTGTKKYKFTVKDPRGVKYVFEEQVNTSKNEIKDSYGMVNSTTSYFQDMHNIPTPYITNSSQLSPPEYSTQQVSEYTGPGDTLHSLSSRSWKLVKIIDTNNNEITFLYNRLSLTNKIYNNTSGKCDFLKVESTGYVQAASNIIQSNFEYYPQAPSLSQMELTQGDKIKCTKNVIESQTSQNTFLSDIIFGSSKVHFTNSSRNDILNDVKIDEINISYKNNIVKKINFNYSYYPEDHALSKRMKLDWVKINEEKYSFEYNQNNVPKFFDYWGYYNGISSQTPFINPFRLYKNNSDIPSWALDLNNQIKDTENKSAHPENSKVGILEKIIYPTGGYTKFEYELNTFDNYFYPNYDNKITVNKNNFEINHLNIDTNFSGRSTPSFNASAGDVINGTINITNGISGTCPYTNSSLKIVKIPADWIAQYNSGTTGKENFWYVVDNGYVPVETVYSKTGFTNTQPFNFSVTISSDAILAARVKYDAACPNTGSPEGSIKATFGTIKYNDYSQNFSSGYGLRVKETSDFINNTLISKRKYNYYGGKHIPPVTSVNDTDPYKMYYFQHTMNGGSEAYYLYSAHGKKISSGNNTFFQTNFLGNGDFVGYDKVEVQELGINNESKGIEAYSFSNTPDERPKFGITDGVSQFEMDKFGYGIRKSSTIQNGSLLKKEIFNSNNQLIKRESLDYFNSVFYQGDGSKSYNVRVIPKESSGYFYHNTQCEGNLGGTVTTYSNFSFYYYPLRGIETMLKKNINTEVLNGTQLITKVENSYDNYNFLSSKNTITPSLDDISEGFTYSHNIDRLKNKNILSENIGKNIFKNGKLIMNQGNKYEDANHYNPTSTTIYELNSPNNNTLPDVTYDKYDSKGNILQYTTKAGIPVAIIWGYEGTQLIAKIEGISYDTLMSTLSANVNDLITKSNDDVDAVSEQILMDALDAFRKNSNLANYHVTIYTHDPLVGIKSITPPSGIRQVYLYDTANRLKEIRENDVTGKLLKEFKYNYKN